MPASANSRIGTELAGYRLEALIGRGGMGVVYRARDLALDRDVALKLLAPHLAEDVSFRERFLTESRVAASLEHPNVVPIHDAGEIDGQLYIVMRLVEGSDLKVVLRDGPLEPARAVADPGADRGRTRRRSRARARAPRRQALERAARRAGARLPGRLRPEPLPRRRRQHRSARPGRSAPPTTSPPSRSAARRSTAAPTSTRSAACSTSASPASRRSAVAPTRRRCSPSSRTTRPTLPGLEQVLPEGPRQGPRRPLPDLRRTRRGRPRGARDPRAETQPLAARRRRRRHRPHRRRPRSRFFLTREDGSVPQGVPGGDTLVRIDPETNTAARADPGRPRRERSRGRQRLRVGDELRGRRRLADRPEDAKRCFGSRPGAARRTSRSPAARRSSRTARQQSLTALDTETGETRSVSTLGAPGQHWLASGNAAHGTDLWFADPTRHRGRSARRRPAGRRLGAGDPGTAGQDEPDHVPTSRSTDSRRHGVPLGCR